MLPLNLHQVSTLLRKSLFGACLVVAMAPAEAKDPVVMTVNGDKVLKSEFEYFYRKNARQQSEPMTPAEYAELFKVYRMKVAEAKAAGLDTVAKFRNEMERYRHELAEPYLVDSVYIDNLLHEALVRAYAEVQTSHIMTLKRRTAESAAAARVKADSIRTLLLNGADFRQLAYNLSDDQGSSMAGGDLGFVRVNEYPYEFELTAYATPEGEISEVVESPVAFHVIKGGKRRLLMDAPSEAELREVINKRLESPYDSRRKGMLDHMTARLERKHDAAVNRQLYDAIIAHASSNGLDSVYLANLRAASGNQEIARIGKEKILLNDYLNSFSHLEVDDPARAVSAVETSFGNFYRGRLVEKEEDWLYANEPDYRNIFNEYYNGSLLYEISLRKVWDAASDDLPSLQKYFEDNRGKYSWDLPMVKGFLVEAVNDSVAASVRTAIASLPEDSIPHFVRHNFRKNAKVEKVLVERFSNRLVEDLLTGTTDVTPRDTRYPSCFLFAQRVLEQPETVEDVKGRVIADYQALLEKDWVDSMRSKYKVKVDKKQLKSIQ